MSFNYKEKSSRFIMFMVELIKSHKGMNLHWKS